MQPRKRRNYDRCRTDHVECQCTPYLDTFNSGGSPAPAGARGRQGTEPGPGTCRCCSCPTTGSRSCWGWPTRCGCAGVAPRSRSRASSASRPAAARRTAISAPSPGLFASPVRSAWLDIPSLVEAAKQTAKSGATEFCIVAAVRGPDKRLMSQVAAGIEAIRNEVEINVACSLGMLSPEQVDRARRDGRAPLQPQLGDRQIVLHQRRHHPHLGRALADTDDGARRGHGGVLRRHPRHGRDAASSARNSPPNSPNWIPTRCR